MKFTQCDWIKHEDDRSTDRKSLASISSVFTNPDGSKLVTSGLDTKIRVWSTDAVLDRDKDANSEAKRLLFTGTAHTGSVMCARFSNSGRFIASGADDRILAVWELQADASGQPKKVFGSDEVNTETWKPVRMLSGHENDILSVAWSPDDAYLASGGVDTMILIWDGDTFAPVRKLVFHTGFVKGLAFDPSGQYLASQSDDSSLKIYDTRTWNLTANITGPFEGAPRDSSNWFLRPGWSPCGTFVVAPNAMNGPVFVAASISRGNDWDSSISLVGHQNIVSVASFNPLLLCRDRSKPPLDSSNIVSVMAMAARSSISVWNSLVPHPIVVLHDVVERDIMDLNWSRDGQTLWVCSSDGHVAALQFDMPELLQGAFPCGSRELDMVLKEFWGDFKRARRPLAPTQPNGSQPNSQQPVQAPQPQKTTILPNGKRRIAPSLLSGLAQPSATQSQSSASGSAAVFPISGPSQAQLPPRAPTQPASAGAPLTSTPTLQRNGFPPPPPAPAPLQQQAQAAFASANAAPAMPMPMQMQMPPPQQQAVYHSHPQYAPQPMLSEPIFASSAMARDALPPNLETDLSLKPTKHHRHVKGSTLGGTREREKREPLIDEIRPAFIPDDEEGSSREMRLAVPAVKSFFKASARDWTEAEVVEAADTEHIEVRNFKPASKEEAEHKPSEVCLVALPAPGEKGATERTMWLDYLEHYVVAGTWNGVFGAVSSIDGMLTVYTNAGRRAMPPLKLDAPCSFLDSAGHFLLAITAKGRLHLWNVLKSKTAFASVHVTDILTASPGQSESASIVAARVRPNGAPIISLSDGKAYSYSADLQSWVSLSLPWWSKGSEFWEGRMRNKQGGSRGGILKGIEGQTNTALVEARYWKERQYTQDEDEDSDIEIVQPEGDESKKRGQDSDWQNAMSLGHLETRLSACDVLESGQEYRQQLSLYAQRLASENLRTKAEELVRFLMGPIYYKPGMSDSWHPSVAGLAKRDLLKEVLSQWAKGGSFKKLAADSQDLLRRVLDPM